MKLINDNLKKTGIFNSILIVIAIVLKVINFSSFPIYIKIDSVVCLFALVFGLFYSLNSYQKDAAKYYKAFMCLYFISSLLSFIASISGGDTNLLIIIANVAILISVFVLAFVKDLGEKKSNGFALTIFALNIIKMLIVVVTKTVLLAIKVHFSNLILACIICMFVSAKYKDKEIRGTK